MHERQRPIWKKRENRIKKKAIQMVSALLQRSHGCKTPNFAPEKASTLVGLEIFHVETCAFCWKQREFTSAVQAWMDSAFQLHLFTFTFFPWTWHLAVVKQALLISKSGTGTRNACFAADHVLQAAIALGLEFSCLFYKLILAKHVSHSPFLSKSLMSLH